MTKTYTISRAELKARNYKAAVIKLSGSKVTRLSSVELVRALKKVLYH